MKLILIQKKYYPSQSTQMFLMIYYSSDTILLRTSIYRWASPLRYPELVQHKYRSSHPYESARGVAAAHTLNADEKLLSEYDSFHFEIESDQGELSRVVMETIDEIDAFLDIDVSTDLEDGYHDSEGDIIYLESLLINNTIPNLSPEDCPDFEDSLRPRCFPSVTSLLNPLAALYFGIRYPKSYRLTFHLLAIHNKRR
ncbi:hypothetical protein Tco_0261330 [Tanacetum coccineum]